MMRQQQVESIALLLRTKSNTCSKIPPFQHTLPIIKTCLSSHLASDQHHLGFATLSAGLTAPWCTHILSVNISAPLTQPTCQAMWTLQVKLPPNYADHHAFHMHREPYATYDISLLGNKPNFHTSGTSGTQLNDQSTIRSSKHSSSPQSDQDRFITTLIVEHVGLLGSSWPNLLLGDCGKHLLINCLRAKWGSWDWCGWLRRHKVDNQSKWRVCVCIPELAIL